MARGLIAWGETKPESARREMEAQAKRAGLLSPAGTILVRFAGCD
jgi:hypothetical protein